MPAFSVFGLHVHCDILLPELLSAQESVEPDIVIKAGEVSGPVVSRSQDLSNYLEGESGRLWINIPGALRMIVTGGNKIIYCRAPGVEDDKLRLFILGSGLGALMMQRDFLVLHGNAVIPQDGKGAILCVGASGAGKSTTAIAMMQRGLKILADDVCPVDVHGQVHQGVARAKLWQDTATQLGIDTAPLTPIHKDAGKYNLPLDEDHCGTFQRIRAVFWLVPEETKEVEIESAKNVERFAILRRNIYRPEYVRVLGLEATYLEKLAEIGLTTPVFKVTRPKTGFQIDRLLDKILKCNDNL